MFSGLIEATGVVIGRQRIPAGARLSIGTTLARDLAPGDSIAVSGVCLTVIRTEGTRLGFDISTETLARTQLGLLIEGDRVNLELAMPANGRFGGHLVSGHIDGSGDLETQDVSARSIEMTFRCDRALAPYMTEKGSVCVDGVSLTVNRVIDEDDFFQFEINHTEFVLYLLNNYLK